MLKSFVFTLTLCAAVLFLSACSESPGAPFAPEALKAKAAGMSPESLEKEIRVCRMFITEQEADAVVAADGLRGIPVLELSKSPEAKRIRAECVSIEKEIANAAKRIAVYRAELASKNGRSQESGKAVVSKKNQNQSAGQQSAPRRKPGSAPPVSSGKQ